MIDVLCADIIYIFSEMLKLWEIWSTPFLTRDPPPPLPDNGKLKVWLITRSSPLTIHWLCRWPPFDQYIISNADFICNGYSLQKARLALTKWDLRRNEYTCPDLANHIKVRFSMQRLTSNALLSLSNICTVYFNRMYLFWKEFFSFGKVFESCSLITGKSVKGYKIYNPEAMKTINPYGVFLDTTRYSYQYILIQREPRWFL